MDTGLWTLGYGHWAMDIGHWVFPVSPPGFEFHAAESSLVQYKQSPIYSLYQNNMNSDQNKASKRSCLLAFLIVFVVIPFSLIALGLFLWFARQSSGRKQLQAKLASIQKKGYPIDDASVDAYYKGLTDPTNSNAWLAILATVQGPEFEASIKGVPIVGDAPEPPRKLDMQWNEEAVAKAFLEKWRPLSDELLRLSIDAKAVRFPIVFDSLESIDMKRLQAFRSVARVLNLRCLVAMRNRDSAEVRETLAGLIGMSRVISAEPMLVGHLVSMAIDGVAIGALKDAIKNDVLNTSDLQYLLPKTMELANIGKDWEVAYAGERALALPVFTDAKRAKESGVTTVFSNSRDAVLYVNLIDDILDISTDDLAEFRSKVKLVESKLRSQSDAGLLAQFDSLLTMQIIPAVQASGDAFIRRALQHRIAALAIVLRIHEDIQGKLPNTLDELTEIQNMEPFSPTKTQRFGFRLVGNSARLWGGSFRDAFAIPSEPPVLSEEEPDRTGAEFWMWELPIVGK